MLIKIDCNQFRDWDSFHSYCRDLFGFPKFYGRNMDAWIDCMTCLDDPDAGMTRIHIGPPEMLILALESVGTLRKRCPDIYAAIVECSALVNFRRIETGEPAIIALSFHV